MSNKNCGNCKFSANHGQGENPIGCCRRFPPTLMYQPMPKAAIVGSRPEVNWGEQASAYPMVALAGWCGEHQDQPSAIFNS